MRHICYRKRPRLWALAKLCERLLNCRPERGPQARTFAAAGRDVGYS